ncbi:hypothetical protein GCM10008090_32580 [Arenicella chitinivorans]|uniref:Uncharacterized protein n=2 Tax=Arenicella chitinivorans TaxID=1329800 RepID=A0A918S1G8_9GAMM|nr:hypothetical protein GCM10008090_32580 [Arenicella chitinivorans]
MLCPSVRADVIQASADHFTLRQEASSVLPPPQLWQRLIQPQLWWHPEHTYSGNAGNLSLDPVAGGVWAERWEGNSVIHGTVVNVAAGTMLRLDAPFGPLQERAVDVVWTISIQAHETGSLVIFEEVANGTNASGLDELAKAVDYVKTEAIKRLVTIADK